MNKLGDLLALLLAHGVALHQLARSLYGGKRCAHFMSDELHGVLVAHALSLGAVEASAHDPMLPHRRGNQRKPRGRHRRHERQYDTAREKYVGRSVRDEQY